MNFLLHNRIEISNGKEKLFFYNKMLKSVFENLRELKNYNSFISLGEGLNSDLVETDFKLNKYIKSYPLETEFLQDDISQNDVYIKKTVVIDDSFLDNKIITEAGLSCGESDNPTIFNYFQLSIDDNNIGIKKQKGEPLVISVYIYLDISKNVNSVGLLTSGKNKFIDYLLGEGLNDKVYISRGKTLIDNSNFVNREFSTSSEKFLCNLNISIDDNKFTIQFNANLGNGEVYEAVMLIGNEPFARIFTIDDGNSVNETISLPIKTNLTIEIGDNIKEVIEVKNIEKDLVESNYFVKKYANSFGDKIHLPFNNIFDSNTPRFLSKDGKMIFFVIENKVYGYKNENHLISKIDTSIINIQNIMKIISFENYVFVVSKSEPFLSAFFIVNEKLEKCMLNFSNFEKSNILSKILNCDITLSKNNNFLLGIIENENQFAYTIYFNFDYENKVFNYDSYLCSEDKFNYILAMFKNEFNDAMIIFLKSAKESFNCKIIYHYSDKTYKDLYSSLAWFLTNDTKEIYVKDRAIVLEKISSPNIFLYLYPEILEIELSLNETNQESFISTNLNYLMQYLGDFDYKIYTLIGYDSIYEFFDGIPNSIDKSKLLDIEFLNDVILFFIDDEKEKILAFNLFDNKSYISGLSSNENSYQVSMSKHNIIGKDSEVFAKFKVEVSL